MTMSSKSFLAIPGFALNGFVRGMGRVNDKMIRGVVECGDSNCVCAGRGLMEVVQDAIADFLDLLEESKRWPMGIVDCLFGALWRGYFATNLASVWGLHAIVFFQKFFWKDDAGWEVNPIHRRDLFGPGEFQWLCAHPINQFKVADQLNELVAKSPPVPNVDMGDLQKTRELWLIFRFSVMVMLVFRQAAISDCYEGTNEFSTERVANMRAGRN
jgi:hypothetical protein